MESKKKLYKWTYLQNRLTDFENEYTVARGEELGEGIVREFGDWYVHTAIFKMGNQQGPTI